jgi:hypothetical protein
VVVGLLLLSVIECTVHEVTDVKETEIHTAEPLVTEHRSSEIEIATEKLKR